MFLGGNNGEGQQIPWLGPSPPVPRRGAKRCGTGTVPTAARPQGPRAPCQGPTALKRSRPGPCRPRSSAEPKPGTKMVHPEPCKELRRRRSAAILWLGSSLTFTYPGFDCDSAGKLELGSKFVVGTCGESPMAHVPRCTMDEWKMWTEPQV